MTDSASTAAPARALAITCLLGLFAGCGDTSTATDQLRYTVTRGTLPVTVRERAEIEAQSDTRVVSRLEGRNTLIYLIEEGTVVEPGEKVAELDASLIEEKQASQAIAVARADAAVKQARKNHEVMEKELLAAERTAESRLKIARIKLGKFLGQARTSQTARGPNEDENAGTNRQMVDELEALFAVEGMTDLMPARSADELVARIAEILGTETAYDLEMGEMANQVLTQIDEISLARADFALAQDTFNHSKDLAANGFITRNELERDRINHKRNRSRVTVALNNLQLLVKFTLHETLIGLKQEEDNARLGLESVKAANEARRVQQSAELISAEAEYKLAKDRLDNWNEQLEHAVMLAPSSGLVVYGRYDWDEPVYEGMEVRERQDIVILPDIRKMTAELRVHEAQVDKVVVGQPAAIKVDAFPGQIFEGHVASVSTLPVPTRRSREVKEYKVHVALDRDNSDGTVRPGMNASVTIQVGDLEDVLYIPLPALERRRDQHYVWLATEEGPVATPVEVGGSNLTHVVIAAGIEEGDEIHLVRPPGAMLPDADDDAEATGETDEATDDTSAASDGGTENAGPNGAASNGGD